MNRVVAAGLLKSRQSLAMRRAKATETRLVTLLSRHNVHYPTFRYMNTRAGRAAPIDPAARDEPHCRRVSTANGALPGSSRLLRFSTACLTTE